MTKLHPFLAVSILVVLARSVGAQESRPFDLDRRITAETLAAPLRFLSHDLLEGRGVGTRGDELARLYLSTELQLAGMTPAGPDGSWIQPVPIVAIKSTIADPLKASGPKEE